MEIYSVLQNNVALKARISEQIWITFISVETSQIKSENRLKKLKLKPTNKKNHSFLEISSVLQNNVAFKERSSEQCRINYIPVETSQI